MPSATAPYSATESCTTDPRRFWALARAISGGDGAVGGRPPAERVGVAAGGPLPGQATAVAGVEDQVAVPEAAGVGGEAVEPLQAAALHPFGRLAQEAGV